ncbi:PIN domain-containing protein [Methylomonas sp. LL1]|uniref:PIN domain-containing protein n=1 Tax=Methylomonas sp. LL1 TaxID=2785785 RepID=UPI0018C353A0|nr:PIN domain-containing protein [Methylomonas sp. LL1]QPK62902.1 PIN domain-containing protein [Methylomonas sp. LL1]
MKILFDTNIILDVLLDRQPHSIAAIELMSSVENKIIDGVLCATTITTIDYLVTKSKGKAASKNAISCLLDLFAVSEVNTVTLRSAINSEFSDFEDAVLYYSGEVFGVDAFVTRNTNDFKLAKLPIYSPIELLGKIHF